MEIGVIVNVRNILLFSLLMANGAILFPESALNASRSLRQRVRRLQVGIRSFRMRMKRRSSRSFWVVDMTKFEP